MSAHYQFLAIFLTLLFFSLVFVAYRRLFEEIDSVSSSVPPKAVGLYFRYDLLAAAALYLLCTVLFFFPTMGAISTSLIGPAEDNMWYSWNMWWGNKAVFEEEHQLIFSNYIFYPEGTSLVYNEFSWYNLIFSFVLSRFLTPVATYNLLILSTFFLSGLGAFLLIRYLVKNSFAALIGGYIFAFNPSHYAHSLHHMNISSIQFIPFFILFFIKAVKGHSKKDLFLSVVFFFLNAACSWTYLIYMSFFMVFAYFYLVIRRKKIILPDVIFKITLIVLITAFIFSPWLFRMVLVGFAHPEITHGGHSLYLADLAGLVVPHSYHLLSGIEAIEKIDVKTIRASIDGNPWEAAVYLGVVNLLLMIFAFRRTIKLTARYYAGLLIFLLLAMGTRVTALGKGLPIALPYYLIKYVPFLGNARAPSRSIVLVYLFIAIIVAFAIRHFFTLKWNNRNLRYGLAVISLLIFLDYYSICHVNTKVYKPACYDVIQKNPGSFGVLDLPSGYSDSERYMMYQTLHHIPIVQGAGISRKIGSSLQDRLYIDDMKRLRKQLTENNVKFIIVHTGLINPKTKNPVDLQDYRDAFNCIYEDDHQVVFEVF